MKSIYTLILFLASVAIFTSCKKQQAKKLAGTYECSVKTITTDFLNGPSTSTYNSNENIEIVNHGTNLEILGYLIPVQKVWDNPEYFDTTFNQYNLKVKFINDSVYIHRIYYSYQYVSSKSYSGKLIE